MPRRSPSAWRPANSLRSPELPRLRCRFVASVGQVTTAPLRIVRAEDRGVRIPLAASIPTVESEAQLRALLASLSGVDAVGADARAAKLATRSIKRSTKLAAIDLAGYQLVYRSPQGVHDVHFVHFAPLPLAPGAFYDPFCGPSRWCCKFVADAVAIKNR